MSGGVEAFKLNENDAVKFLATKTHLGSSNSDFQMEQYIYKRRNDGVNVISLRHTWEKLLLAARAIAAVENPSDVCVVSGRPYSQRALLKYAAHTGATPICGRFTPGAFTNYIQKTFKEPRLLVVSDPRVDHQAVREASYVGIPVIAFCNADTPLKYVDIAIPCNNKGEQSIGLMWWFLAREVLTLRGKISKSTGFEIDGNVIMPDLYFYRDPQEAEKEEPVQEQVQVEVDHKGDDDNDQNAGVLDLNAVPEVKDWAAETANWQQGDASKGGEWDQAQAGAQNW